MLYSVPMGPQVTCQEQFTRGLKPNSAGPVQPAHGTNIYRKSNGDWKLVVHWSGRLSLVRDQVDELVSPLAEDFIFIPPTSDI